MDTFKCYGTFNKYIFVLYSVHAWEPVMMNLYSFMFAIFFCSVDLYPFHKHIPQLFA